MADGVSKTPSVTFSIVVGVLHIHATVDLNNLSAYIA